MHVQYCTGSHVGACVSNFAHAAQLVCKLEHLFLVLYLDKRHGVGQVCCVLADPAETAIAVKSLLVRLARQMSPSHGARIVATTLNNPTLYQECEKNMSP